MKALLLKHATVVNEGNVFVADVLIENGLISEIGLISNEKDKIIIDATGKLLLPGVIDTHVHFREPGPTHKGDIYSESRAAIAGGTTSYFEMPNTIPNTLSDFHQKEKALIASTRSLANYSFYLGINTENFDELISTDNSVTAAITDDGLYFSGKGNMLSNNTEYMGKLFASLDKIIALHCEDEEIIDENIASAISQFGQDIPVEMHSKIRNEEACYRATFRAKRLAQKHNARLHVLHLSTAREAALFDNDLPLAQKRQTAEVCIHHLWFCDEDYKSSGATIKWNPSIKTKSDRAALLQALIDDRIDIVSTDHAPHTLAEKKQKYLHAPSGGPMVQHSLVAMLELVKRKAITLGKLVEKMCHNPAILFRIEKRGFIRAGYHADLVLVDMNHEWTVDSSNILYKCGWSPFSGFTFSSSVCATIVNGRVVYNNGNFDESIMGQQLLFHTDC